MFTSQPGFLNPCHMAVGQKVLGSFLRSKPFFWCILSLLKVFGEDAGEPGVLTYSHMPKDVKEQMDDLSAVCESMLCLK